MGMVGKLGSISSNRDFKDKVDMVMFIENRL